jgi:hypothetical protein
MSTRFRPSRVHPLKLQGDRQAPPLDFETAAGDTGYMGVDAPTPLPTRPSANERERILRLLRDRAAEERLSLDTFSARAERALAARSHDELNEVVADLPAAGGLRARLVRAVERASALSARLEAAWREPRLPRLTLPAVANELTLGRSHSCDCVLSDPTVSRRHASLSRSGNAWLLRDLRSTNGTRVNGWRVTEPVEVAPGDRISFGAARYRLSGPARFR